MSADECLVRLADQARGSLEDFITDDGTISIAAARAAGKLHLLKAYTEPGEKSGGRIELYSAQSALELIGKHHKLFTDNINLKMTPDKLEAWLSDGEKPGESEFGDD